MSEVYGAIVGNHINSLMSKISELESVVQHLKNDLKIVNEKNTLLENLLVNSRRIETENVSIVASGIPQDEVIEKLRRNFKPSLNVSGMSYKIFIAHYKKVLNMENQNLDKEAVNEIFDEAFKNIKKIFPLSTFNSTRVFGLVRSY